MKFELLEVRGSEGIGFALCQTHSEKSASPTGVCGGCCTCQSGSQCT